VWIAAAAGALAAAVVAARVVGHRAPPVAAVATDAPAAPPATFVGEAVCASCHAPEAAAWRGSHHQLAMQPARPDTVLGDFAGARLTHAGVTSRLYQRDGRYMATTDGADGALHDYAITYTFGVAPLQQYLVDLPGGRRQALEIAWDSRPAAAGGQRWFHLYPGEAITGTDPLHWTGPAERWNFMCADCHSTRVRKGWDARTGTYATSFAEMPVSCEACHGPGSRHVDWAGARGRGWTGGRDESLTAGLAIALDERRGVSFVRDAATGRPHRSAPRRSEREIQMCARCHARRGLIHEDDVHGQPVDDDYRVALLDDELYHPDGQIKGEVYEYGSFIQSRMFAEGVTCSDCHDPHRPELRAAGDNVCLRCHAAAAYRTPSHHFHDEASAGARCAGCHMPAATYMVVDARRDHSLRVPRPDLSVKLGVPNACNGCHADRPATWAARTVRRWYGRVPTGFQRFAEALAAGAAGTPGAQAQLAAVAADAGQPAIARASALARMDRPQTPETLTLAGAAARDGSPLVRRAAVHLLGDAEPAARAALVAPRLADDVRAVRIEAAVALAGLPPGALPPEARGALDRATAELVAAHELNGDRPEAHLDLANLRAAEQRFADAEAELRRALAIDPAFAPAAVNLADLFRATGRDGDAAPVLRAALDHAPKQPALMHAMGLVLVRQKRLGDALPWLEAAARAGAGQARYGYVYAVALHDAGRAADARAALDDVLRARPYDRDALAALAAFAREAGDLRGALRAVERLAALDPQDAQLQMAAADLRGRLSSADPAAVPRAAVR
jgi:predicted CXXCH cytochrome family protein